MFRHKYFFIYYIFRVKEELFVFKYIPFGIFIEIISIMFRLRDLEPHHLTAGVFSLNENGNYFQKHTYRANKYYILFIQYDDQNSENI